MKSVYYVAVHTMDMCNEEAYNERSGKLLNVVRDILADGETVLKLTNGGATSCHTESEILTTPESGLIAKCVVELEGETRVPLDKSKLTALLKSKLGQSVKVEKKSVVEAA